MGELCLLSCGTRRAEGQQLRIDFRPSFPQPSPMPAPLHNPKPPLALLAIKATSYPLISAFPDTSAERGHSDAPAAHPDHSQETQREAPTPPAVQPPGCLGQVEPTSKATRHVFAQVYNGRGGWSNGRSGRNFPKSAFGLPRQGAFNSDSTSLHSLCRRVSVSLREVRKIVRSSLPRTRR